MAKTIPCPTCKKQISVEAEACPKCGQPITPEIRAEAEKKLKQGKWGCLTFIAIVVVVGVLIGIFSDNKGDKNTINKSTQTDTASPEPSKQPDPNEVIKIKGNLISVVNDLLAIDRTSSKASEKATSMAQQLGKGITMGQIYGEFKTSKSVSGDAFSKLSSFKIPNTFPKNVYASLDDARKAFQVGAMLREQIADEIMEWLDTQKPSLEASFQEKSSKVTIAMTQAVLSLTGAMSAAGFTTEEIEAELGRIGEGK